MTFISFHIKRTLFLVLSLSFLLTACASNPNSGGLSGVESEPDKAAQLNLELGVAYMNKQDNEKALNRLNKALAIDPNFADAHNAIAILHARLGQTELAEKHYAKAVQLAPKDSRALNNYGQFLCTQGNAVKADQMFMRAVDNPLYRTPHIAYLNAGMCARSNNNIDQAEVYFREALKVDSRMYPALFQMADISYTQKHYTLAQSYLNRYAEATEHNAASLWLAVRVEKALGDRDAAASYGLLLKNRFPDSQETRLLLKTDRP